MRKYAATAMNASYYVPFLLLACPLMHLFMQGGRGDHGSVRSLRR